MQSEETFIEKTFQMINELNGMRNFIPVKVQYLPGGREINVSRALNDIHNHGLSLLNCHIFYLDNFKKLSVFMGTYPFKQQILLKLQLFLETTIQIRYRKISSGSSPKNEPNKPNPQIKKFDREKKTKQKSIKEVLQLVSKWRNLYEQLDYNGKRLHTLESAAQKIGVLKKTLDDYYYKIKNALNYGFDLENNMNERIGTLRQFVKECTKNKTPKLTKIQNNFNLKMYPFLSFLCVSLTTSPQKPDEIDIGKYLADDPVWSSDSQGSLDH